MKSRTSSDSRHTTKSRHTSNGNKQHQGVGNDSTTTTSLPNKLLERISNEILDHTKQLGLFDEMRLKLLANIELSKEYFTVKNEFRREVELFCSHVDLTLPRSKLRERLNARTLYKSARRLEEHVHQVSREHRHEFRKIYNKQAIDFLKRRMKADSVDNHLPT